MAAVTLSGMLAAEAAALAAGWTEEQLLDLAGERLGRALGRFFPNPGTVRRLSRQRPQCGRRAGRAAGAARSIRLENRRQKCLSDRGLRSADPPQVAGTRPRRPARSSARMARSGRAAGAVRRIAWQWCPPARCGIRCSRWRRKWNGSGSMREPASPQWICRPESTRTAA